jgi:hypothetical protein
VRGALRCSFLLKVAFLLSFTFAMGISGSASSPAVTSTQFQVAVAKKALDSADQQGQQSLQLIQSAAAPANVPSGVGQRLNVRA